MWLVISWYLSIVTMQLPMGSDFPVTTYCNRSNTYDEWCPGTYLLWSCNHQWVVIVRCLPITTVQIHKVSDISVPDFWNHIIINDKRCPGARFSIAEGSNATWCDRASANYNAQLWWWCTSKYVADDISVVLWMISSEVVHQCFGLLDSLEHGHCWIWPFIIVQVERHVSIDSMPVLTVGSWAPKLEIVIV